MPWIWIGFILLILTLLAIDLGVLNRKAHVIGVKEALGWSVLWISLALLFSVFVYFGYQHHWLGLGLASDGSIKIDPVDKVKLEGHTATVKFLTGYVIEESLSVDNLFVIAIILAFFKVPGAFQHRLLFWGILGALIMRGSMIALGATLIARFHWILYLFGAFLIITAIRMLFLDTEESAEMSTNPIVRLAQKWLPVCDDYHGSHFVVPRSAAACAESGSKFRWMFTPMFLALIMVETTDLIFAVDSIPAIFAITGDPFIVFTSNVFAILGLRSMYFALAGMMDKFRYLKISLAFVLGMVGTKMLIADWARRVVGDHFDFWLLGAIFAILGSGVVASVLVNRREARAAECSDPVL